jgi:hypothetical protein
LYLFYKEHIFLNIIKEGISMRLLYFLLVLYAPIIYSIEYIYPVTCLNNGTTILYIHQHNPNHIELLQWNTLTNQHIPLLWSLFNPANLQLLPNQLGFSFVDNGRLRIKLFQKRSPKTVEFDEPIYNINGLEWLDEHECYCSAQQGEGFCLFALSDNGDVHCLAREPHKDYMYPQKIGDYLFYIERSSFEKVNYRIIQSYYSNNQSSHVIMDFQNKPIIFLQMVSEKEGFVLEHAEDIHNDDKTVKFSYHHLTKDVQGEVWDKEVLFSFSIPAKLVVSGDERLYESLLPLLPRVEKNEVYFVDCASDYLEPYSYNLASHTLKKIKVPRKNGHYFVPILCGSTFYCGGTKEEDLSQNPFISFFT